MRVRVEIVHYKVRGTEKAFPEYIPITKPEMVDKEFLNCSGSSEAERVTVNH